MNIKLKEYLHFKRKSSTTITLSPIELNFCVLPRFTDFNYVTKNVCILCKCMYSERFLPKTKV